MQRRAGDDAEAAQRHPCGDADGHGDDRDRDQRRLGDGRRKTDRAGEYEDPEVIVPTRAIDADAEELWIRQLCRHDLADREQCLFEADEEQRQADQHVYEPVDDAAQVRRPAADRGDLEEGEDDDDRQHVQRCRRCGRP